MTEIRHIVFDIGKVLINYDPEAPFRRLIPDAVERAHFFTHVCSNDWNIRQDAGRTWHEAEAELIALHPDKAELIRAFRRHWREMVSSDIPESVALMRRLIADGQDVTLLTNFAPDTFREAQIMYPFLTETRGVTVSGDAKVIKPDPEIYRIHTEAFRLEPSASLFIDDSEKNVKGAQDFGWNAILFIGPEQLKTDLKRFGLVG